MVGGSCVDCHVASPSFLFKPASENSESSELSESSEFSESSEIFYLAG